MGMAEYVRGLKSHISEQSVCDVATEKKGHFMASLFKHNAEVPSFSGFSCWCWVMGVLSGF